MQEKLTAKTKVNANDVTVGDDNKSEKTDNKTAAGVKKKARKSHVHYGHRDRLRNRYLNEGGLASFEDHNILELLLFYCIPQKDTNEMAHEILDEFDGSLSAVLEAAPEELMKKCKLTKNTATLITMVPHLARAYERDKMKRRVLFGRRNIEAYIVDELQAEWNVEKIMLVCIDNRFQRLFDSVVSVGSVNFSAVDKRKIAELVLRHNATGAIIAHNHPAGFAVPSTEDIETTIELRRTLNSVGVKLVDHIIVCPDDYISMADSARFATIFEMFD